jgi:hypothetical protein
MKKPRHEIEAQVAAHRRDAPEGETPPGGLRPRIRRQLERICKALDVEYDDLVELHVSYNMVTAIYYDRNENGDLYRDEFNRVVTKPKRIPVDTFTFLGDEKDT